MNKDQLINKSQITNNKLQKDFELFRWTKKEISWVLAVLVIILGISWRQLITGEMKTRDAQRRSDVELVSRALNKYYADHQIYPAADSDGRIISCGNRGLAACQWGYGKIVDIDQVVYLKDIPVDPQTWKGVKYVYTTNGTRTAYKIYVHLEYLGDPVVKKGLTAECGNGVQCNWYVANEI